jgi:hypothetical protein
MFARSAIVILLAGAPAVFASVASAGEGQASSAGKQVQATNPSDAASAAKSHTRVRLGGILIGAGYARYPGLYPYWGYSRWYSDPFLFAPIYAPGYYTGFAYQPNMGAVKLEGADRNAWVYLDGALAGKAEKLKQMWLDPGSYELELRDGDRRATQKIYVLSGKTLKVTPELMGMRP